jgi:NAD-dependent deacetylase
MPEGVVGAAIAAVEAADLVLVVGTTLLVSPANALPAIALRQGAPLVVVNPFDASPYDECAAGLVRWPAGAFFADVACLLAQGS